MTVLFSTRRLVSLLTVPFLLAACAPQIQSMNSAEKPRGQTVYGITTTNQLASFGTANPGTSVTTRPISGLIEGELLLGLDFEPGFNGTPTSMPPRPDRAGGTLFALSRSSRLYSLNLQTGAATVVGSQPFSPGLTGMDGGLDFNPQVNRLRVHGDDGQNLRLNQESGAVIDFDMVTPGIQPDKTLMYKVGDVAAGQNPNIAGSAYTNSVRGTTSTVLYAIDSARDTLVTVASPNDGVLSTVGALGVDTTQHVGFDIAAQLQADGTVMNTAYATLTPVSEGASSLYTVDLTTGRATLLGALGRVVLRSIAVAP